MKTLYIISICIFTVFSGYGQEQSGDDLYLELGKTAELTDEQSKKMEAAFTVLDAVQKAGNYVQSLGELISNSRIPLPAGIKSEQGGYELIVHKITRAKDGHSTIYATCAFPFKDTNQRIAFEGQAEIEGKNGLGTHGRLTLIAPIRRNLGQQSALIIREGTSVAFGCNGIESFDAKLAWLTTSDKIIAVKADGSPTNKPLGVFFDAHFEDFDNYLVSLDINQRFMYRGLDDVIFTLRGAVIDQSDTENSGMMRFPPDYFAQGSAAGAINLWKGVAVSEASVSLPAFFKNPDDTTNNSRITLAFNQVLFDENGFTGNVTANNIIPGETLHPDDWALSLTGLGIGILKNQVEAFSLLGAINIPPFGQHSLLPYSAYFDPVQERYAFAVTVAGDYDFPALRSTLSLTPLSSITLEYRNRQIYPRIDATGQLTVNAPLSSEGDSTKVLSVPGIAFEHLVLTREAPYVQIGSIAATGTIQSPSVAGFGLSIANITNFHSDRGDGLSFTGGISLNGSFDLNATTGVKLYGDYEKWKFNKVEIDRVNVDFQSSNFKLQGGVWFKHGDAVYGDGFSGKLTLGLLNKFAFDAVGIFGTKDDFRYFLADTYFETNPVNGLPIPPALKLYGFGGGLYQRMQQAGKTQESLTLTNPDDLDFGRSLSGIRYLPDKSVGLGVMATSKFALIGSDKAFNAKVGFEMQFNNYGGLNFVQLRGDGAFMDAPEKWGDLSDNIATRTAEQQASGKNQPSQQTLTQNDVPENKNSALLSASVLLEYDAINNRFNGNMNAYLNIANVLKGVGPNDRLGWTNILVSPEKWYLKAGSPSDRLGINVLNLAQMTGYFMMGNDIPALPLPPSNVMQLLSPDKQARLNSRQSSALTGGKGFAFGAAFEAHIEPTFLIFYARMNLGLGAEFMLTNLNGAVCADNGQTPGINGWYAQGQAWAYVDAGIGLKAKVFGKTKRFEILDLSVATLLEGKGPNPSYFAGTVGGRYSVLGGLIKGQCNFEFEMGKECKPVGGSPFGEDIIAQLTPAHNANEVNVFAAPQVLFNIPVETEITIDEDDGSKGTYRVKLNEFSVKYKDNNQPVAGEQKTNEDRTVIMLNTSEPFESRKNLIAYAQVSFQKKSGNNWVDVKDEKGQTLIEKKTAEFQTGDRPKEILPEHVAYSYPSRRQYNFYPNETNQGYLLLKQNYSYLFSTEKPEGFVQKLRISAAGGQAVERDFTYTTSSSVSGVKMEINFSLANTGFVNDKIYKLALVNIPRNANAAMTSNVAETTRQMEGTDDGSVEITKREATGTLEQLSEKEIYALNFKTSRYNTFAEKMQAFNKQEEGWRDYIAPYLHFIKLNLRNAEMFDAYEMGNAGMQEPTIHFTANTGQTNWYNQTIYRPMYVNENYLPVPVDQVEILTGLPDKLLTDNEITMNSASGYDTQGIIRYALSPVCYQDLRTAQTNIARRALTGTINQTETSILATSFPPTVFQGNYPVTVSYLLPGKKTVSSSFNLTMYNPMTP
ncbi:MAG: hypothetical protein LBN18_02025 [Dysgonamonadaceae bacterium]|jgi:hypothetical protein|nr:hypothetical protein [Dysgonamonadaceae bacterium]